MIVSLKSSALAEIPKLIHPLLHNETRVLLIMNGLIEEDLLHYMQDLQVNDDSNVGMPAAIYGGMAFICSSRPKPGLIDHTFAGFLSAGVAASNIDNRNNNNNNNDDNASHEQAFRDLWAPTRVDVGFEPSLLRGRWKKNVWNLPFSGISVAMGGISIDVLVQDVGLRELALKVMDETVAIANADLQHNGHDPSAFLGNDDVRCLIHRFVVSSVCLSRERTIPQSDAHKHSLFVTSLLLLLLLLFALFLSHTLSLSNDPTRRNNK